MNVFFWLIAWLCVMCFVCGAVPGMATFLGNVLFSGFTVIILAIIGIMLFIGLFWWSL